MRPVTHFAIAVVTSVPVYAITHSLGMTVMYGLTEIFIDLDHVIDYLFFSQKPYSLKKFLKRGEPLTWSHMVYFFHSHELVFVAVCLSFWFDNHMISAATAGFFVHLLLDEIGNRLPWIQTRIHPFFYFFTFRIRHHFDIKRLIIVRNPQGSFNRHERLSVAPDNQRH